MAYSVKKVGIAGFLAEHAGKDPVSFHMPGHKGERLYRENGYGGFLDHIMDCDITEIPGADNLFQTEGVILETMERYRELYSAKASYLLINGSSAGLIAAVMAAVSPGGKMIMARNCHKSVFNGLALAGAMPAYIYPEIIKGHGISGEISPDEVKRALKEHPDSEALILTSPNYYGICSDIRSIAEEVHKAGKVLIVDQAHGAHLAFFDKYVRKGGPRAAENAGADMVINSIHKTLASFTQTAIANICSDRADRYAFEDKLQLVESTSPSYLLMASLDINARLLEERGNALIGEWEKDLRYFYDRAKRIRGLKVLSHKLLDHTKINIDMSACGLTGLDLEALLMEKGIYTELATGNILMCMTGIGNRRYDYDRLLDALKSIAESHEPKKGKAPFEKQYLTVRKLKQEKPPKKKEMIPIEQAAGRVCAVSVIPYPPGIPLICPGEIMDGEVLAYAAELRRQGEKVMGIDDKGRVAAGKDPERQATASSPSSH